MILAAPGNIPCPCQHLLAHPGIGLTEGSLHLAGKGLGEDNRVLCTSA
jgi:hypothetical protein